MAIDDIPPEVRESLGIDSDAYLTGPVEVSRPADQQQGAGFKEAGAFVTLLALGQAATPVERRYQLTQPPTVESGIRFEVHDVEFVRAFDPAGRELRASVYPPGLPMACLGPAVGANVPIGTSLWVSLPTGECVMLEATSAKVWTWRVVLPPTAEAPEFGWSPVAVWVQESGDSWLAGAAEERAAEGGAWTTAIAAGMFARLEVPPRSPWMLDESGRVRAAAPRPRPYESWVRSLDAAQLEYLEERALVAIDRIFGLELPDLIDDFRPLDEDWRARYADVCRRREELEGVCVLLGCVGKGPSLRDALNACDENASPFVRGFIDRRVEDPLLQRVAERDPSAWWGYAAAE